jgi:hypothetical protein
MLGSPTESVIIKSDSQNPQASTFTRVSSSHSTGDGHVRLIVGTVPSGQDVHHLSQALTAP